MGDSDADRRASSRIKVQIAARVMAPIPATIIDLSDGGCQIRLLHPIDLPQQLIIEFNDRAYLCERRWTKGVFSGLQFLDLWSRAQRRGPESTRPAPRGLMRWRR